jgi:hypothetical protein
MAFYARMEPDPEVAKGYAHLQSAITTLTTKKRFAEASAVRGVLAQVFRQFEVLGTTGADEADRIIRKHIAQTQVRPDATGSLRGAVQSRPLANPLPGGAVGIASIEELDKGARDPDYPAKSYWRAQEYGTDAHIGRKVPGFFQPGQARANQADFRVHPYFQAMPGQKNVSRMVIARPLEARYFLRDGTQEFAGWHVVQTERILGAAISRLLALRIL